MSKKYIKFVEQNNEGLNYYLLCLRKFDINEETKPSIVDIPKTVLEFKSFGCFLYMLR